MLSEWQDIPAASDPAALNVRRADPHHPLDFRIGRDFRGRYVFQLEAAFDGADGSRPLPAPAGIEIVRDGLEGGRARLSLTLTDRTDFEIFRVLCADLLTVTQSIPAREDWRGMSIVLARLSRWQEVLARRRAGALTRNEIIGLFGELLFLRDLLVPRIGAAAAIASWRGPFGDEQDFAIGDTIFEVKTQGSSADRRLSISSEDQLDTSRSRIVLCQQGLAPAPPGDLAGRTLNQLVAEVRDLIREAGTGALDRLELALFESGWETRAEYDEDIWSLVDRVFYEVREGFPSIVRADLRPGVEEVRYRVRVADCLPFRIDTESAMGALAG